jgi:hypothetical protein
MVIEILLPYLTLPSSTYRWSADSCEAEGTVCPISFVKDVLVRTLTGHCIPSPSLETSCRQPPYHGNFQNPSSSDFRVGFRYSDQSDQTLALASAVAIFMYRCKRPKREEEVSPLWVTCNCTSVAILQPSSQAFSIRHNNRLLLVGNIQVARDGQSATQDAVGCVLGDDIPFPPCGQEKIMHHPTRHCGDD